MAPYQDPAGVDVDFRNISRCHKAYRKYCQSQVAAYGFTPGEVDVLTVLSNNPQIDTAADISQFRNISKALVCRSVDALVRQGFLLSAPDERDRRLQHLSLTEEAAPIAAVFTNGGVSSRLYERYCLPRTNMAAIRLPSTSPANAAFSVERLKASWRRINDLLPPAAPRA